MLKKEREVKVPIFFNDIPIDKKDEDKFQFYQIAELLKTAIDTASKAMHICLTGQWGSGKSTVLSLLEKMYELEKGKVKVVTISVWKFAENPTSLQRKILRELELEFGMNKQDDQYDQEGYERTKNETETITGSGIYTLAMMQIIKQKTFWVPLLFGLLFSVLTTIIELPILKGFLSGGAYMGLITAVIAVIVKSQLTVGKSVTYNGLPLNYGDQFERRFEKLLKKNSKKYDKLIIVFDDMDRLPHNQLYASLNTIRTFLRMKPFDNCTFIVPCDETILREEINEALSEGDEEGYSNVENRVSEFLNKTFDLMIKLPLVEQRNMKEYAKTLIELQKTNWSDVNAKLLNSILSILIHSEIKTPRQVKKILNAYTADWELAKKRDAENNTAFLTNNPRELAIFTVIKSDYPYFYEELKRDAVIFRNIDSIDALAAHFNEKGLFPRQFISKILKLIPTDIRPYLYFLNNDLNPITGNLRLMETRDSLLNGDKSIFKDQFNTLSDEEKFIVLDSAIEEFGNEIETDNIFNIVFTDELISNYISDIKKQDWENEIENNILKILEYPLSNLLHTCNAVVESPIVWKSISDSILEKLTKEKSYKELFDVWKEQPKLIDNLKLQEELINLISSHAFEIGMLEANENPYYVFESLFNIEQHHHSLFVNSKWVSVLADTIDKAFNFIKENTEEDAEEDKSKAKLPFNLSQWLQTMERQGVPCEYADIKNILGGYEFLDEKSFSGFDLYLVEKFKNLDQPFELAYSLSYYGDYEVFHLIDNSTLQVINEYYSNINYDEKVEKHLRSLMNSAWNFNIEVALRLIKNMHSIQTIMDFLVSKYKFGTGEYDSEIKQIILGNETSIDVSTIHEVAEDNDVISNIEMQHDLLLLLEDSNALLQQFKAMFSDEYNFEKFDSVKFNISSQAFKSRFKLPLILQRGKEDYLLSIESEMTSLITEQALYINNGLYPYRGQWRVALNSVFGVYMNELSQMKINWSEKFLYLRDELSLLDYLEGNTLDTFLSTASKFISSGDIEFNEYMLLKSTITHESHVTAFAERYQRYSLEQQKSILGTILENSDSYDHFYDKFKEQLKNNPELVFVNHLISLNFGKDEKEEMIQIILEESRTKDIDNWFNNQLRLMSEKPHKIIRNAMKKILGNPYGITIRNIDMIRDMLSYSDERTELALMILLELIDKKQAESMKEKIKSIYSISEFSELTEKVIKKYGWRKPRVNSIV